MFPIGQSIVIKCSANGRALVSGQSGLRTTPRSPKPRPSMEMWVSLAQSFLFLSPKDLNPFLDSEKWLISYENLSFDDLVSTGSSGEVYLGYYYGTPVAIKSNCLQAYNISSEFLHLGDDEKARVEREYMFLRFFIQITF